MIGVSILHLKRERTTGRVEAVDRIAGNERQVIDGILRNEVPIDDIAKNLVDPNPILVNSDPLWCSNHRGGDVTAIVDIKLKIVTGLAAQRDEGQRLGDRLQQLRRLRVLESRSASGRDV